METEPFQIGGDEIELGTPRYKWFIHYTRATSVDWACENSNVYKIVGKVWFWHMKEQILNQTWIINQIVAVMFRKTNCQCYQSAMDISGAFIPVNLSSATP